MSNNILNLVETTLHDQTGHSFTYVQCLLQANQEFDFDFHVWMDRRGKQLFTNSNCTAHAYFFRPLRQVQKIFLYRKLLQQAGNLFIGTSELWDLRILAFFAKLNKPKAKVFVHFHQFKQTAKKIACLQKISEANLGFNLATPTDRLSEIFTRNGFKCTTIPCPTYYPTTKEATSTAKFDKVLYAGAARNDKGFPEVVQVVKYNRAQGKNTKFEIQVSPPSSLRYDEPTQAALHILEDIAADNLILHRETLNQEQYLDQFKNSICLLVYKQRDYQDKFSAVALDSFYAGCPIITAKNTWMGDMAERYTAGIALDTYTPESIQQAIEDIAANYAVYNANAKNAAQQLSQLHDPKHTLRVINGTN